jgi:hypothetical protein
VAGAGTGAGGDRRAVAAGVSAALLVMVVGLWVTLQMVWVATVLIIWTLLWASLVRVLHGSALKRIGLVWVPHLQQFGPNLVWIAPI